VARDRGSDPERGPLQACEAGVTRGTVPAGRAVRYTQREPLVSPGWAPVRPAAAGTE